MNFSVSCCYFLPSYTLDTSHLLAIKRNLQGITNWLNLGLELGMDFPFLDKINKSHGGEVDMCKIAMLYSWLETGGATKSSLVAALTAMGEESIAAKL